MKNVYQIGSGELTFDIIERIINENLKLELASEARERIQKCRDYLDKKIANSDTPLYGITTGFGSLCNRNISSDELSTLQENLVKSHACSVGRRDAACHSKTDVSGSRHMPFRWDIAVCKSLLYNASSTSSTMM